MSEFVLPKIGLDVNNSSSICCKVYHDHIK
jgi:hypothetical protein